MSDREPGWVQQPTIETARQGRVSSLEVSFQLPAPLGPVFDYFSDPANLDPSTPSWFRLRVLTPLPLELAEGTLLDYRIRWRWLVGFRWQSHFAVWKPPTLFTYVQSRGPFHSFRHEHRFEALPDGTRVIDRVEWAAPGGRPVVRWLRRDLTAIFLHRMRVVEEIFAGPQKP